jgi:hypothetical protein
MSCQQYRFNAWMNYYCCSVTSDLFLIFWMRFNAWMNYYCCSVTSDLFFILNARVVILLITEIFAWIYRDNIIKISFSFNRTNIVNSNTTQVRCTRYNIILKLCRSSSLFSLMWISFLGFVIRFYCGLIIMLINCIFLSRLKDG